MDSLIEMDLHIELEILSYGEESSMACNSSEEICSGIVNLSSNETLSEGYIR